MVTINKTALVYNFLLHQSGVFKKKSGQHYESVNINDFRQSHVFLEDMPENELIEILDSIHEMGLLSKGVSTENGEISYDVIA